MQHARSPVQHARMVATVAAIKPVATPFWLSGQLPPAGNPGGKASRGGLAANPAGEIWSRDIQCLNVPKCEIFDPFNFRYFYTLR
jgi:hypothetical protein